MGKTTFKIPVLILTSILFSGCGAFGPLTTTSTTPPVKIQKIALISTYLTFYQSLNSLSIRNTLMSENVRSFSGEINNLLSGSITETREVVANSLGEKLKCSVLFGKQLQETNGYSGLKEKYNFPDALKKEDEFFPDIISNADDLVPFNFQNGDIESFFKDQNNYKNIVSEICNTLNVNHMAVSFSYLFPTEGSMIMGNFMNIATDLYLFNKNGECIAAEKTFTNVTFKSKEIEGYQQALDNLPVILKALIERKIDKRFIEG